MAYAVTMVHCEHITATVQKVGASGLPTVPFNYFLCSYWVCLGPPPNTRIVSLSNIGPFGGISIDYHHVAIQLKTGVSTPLIYDASFACSPTNVLTHLLVSLSPLTEQVQVYVNDVLLSPSSGGWTGQPVGSFNIPAGSSQWGVGSAGSTAPGPGAADVFAAAPSAFFDLNNVANRRKFINADLTPVDLGTNAASVLGAAPPIYLTIRPGGVAADFSANNGTGGAWTVQVPPLTLQTPGSCVLATLPPELVTITDAELMFQPMAGFLDFNNESVRRLFVSASGTPAWMGPAGAIPFSGQTPAVYLTTLGEPTDFAQNNGAGGPFAASGEIDPATGPGCTPYYVTEATGPAAQPEWRLTVSDDGSRTWSRLVKPREIGALGHYKTRLRWLKMGQFRQRSIKLECTDPVRRNIIGVYVDLDQGMA